MLKHNMNTTLLYLSILLLYLFIMNNKITMSYGKNTFAYFRIFVEFDNTNNNQNNYIHREFRYQRIHDDYTQHLFSFMAKII